MPSHGITYALQLFIKNGGFENLYRLPVFNKDTIPFKMILLLILTSSYSCFSMTNIISRIYKTNSFENI